MNTKKRILAVCMAAALAVSVMACKGGGNDSSSASTPSDSSKTDSSGTSDSSTAPNTGDVVKLQVFSMPANTSGEQSGWWVDVLKEKVGVTIELLPSGDQGEQKLQTLMAGGELPDIVVFKDAKQVENAVAGDMLLAYDDYKDQLPNLFANAASSLQYYADNVSNGTGKSYSVGNSISSAYAEKGGLNFGPSLRYDIYKQVGSPAIPTMEDYLTVTQKMQEALPTNAEGQKVYPFTWWTDWDKYTAHPAVDFANTIGTDFIYDFLDVDYAKNKELRSILDEGSAYLRGLKFGFTANQMGLVDPDSLSQRYEDSLNKGTSGRTLFSWWTWGYGNFNSPENTEQGVGFAVVPSQDALVMQAGLSPTGSSWSWSVSKATKYVDKCMAYVDFMYSFDGLMTLMNGPQGVIWDVNDKGEPYILEEGYPYITDGSKELPAGGKLGDGLNVVNSFGLDGTTVNPTFGVPLSNGFWTKPDYAPADTKLQDMWQEDFGAEDQVEYYRKNNLVAYRDYAPLNPVTDDIEQLSARVGDVVKTESWKMIFAKDEAEYESIKNAMIEKANGIGLQEIIDWAKTAYTEALELGSKYTK